MKDYVVVLLSSSKQFNETFNTGYQGFLINIFCQALTTLDGCYRGSHPVYH